MSKKRKGAYFPVEKKKEKVAQLLYKERSVKPEEILTGRFLANAKGFGFVEIEGEAQDLFIAPEHVLDAFHGDLVEVRILHKRGGKRREGEVLRVVERAVTKVVGVFERSKNYGFVLPDNKKIACDIYIPKEKTKGAVNGHKVVCTIYDYGNAQKSPEGEITEIIGHINDPGVDIMSIVLGHDLPLEFPERVLNQAERVGKPVSEADMQGRTDLRNVQMVTIDGDDAKDLDDAVSLTKEGDIYHLGVHIADVANYVQENSALDKEALKRGTSVYLVDRVIPMLPHTLCNGICSLNAGEDRLALSCLMEIDGKGQVRDYRIVESVIHVDKRMSYHVVADLLEHEDSVYREEHAHLLPMFREMKALADILHRKRRKRGSIDFDLPETEILLDANGRPT